MKQQLLDTLYYIISSSTSIKLHIDKIEELRLELEKLDDFTDIDRLELSNIVKNRVQAEAGLTIAKMGWGLILMATGTGKSKIVIDRVARSQAQKVLIVVPTIKLRDETWRDEFYKWNKQEDWVNVQLVCYDSLHTIIGERWAEVYLDECHHLTPASAVFFQNNTVLSCVGLTATKPTDRLKEEIFKSLNMFPLYEINLDEAIKLGLIAPYDITIVTTKMDNTHKYIKAGNQYSQWLQTEKSAYDYITQRIDGDRPRKNDKLTRMRLLYNFKTKLYAAKYIIQHIPSVMRTIVFAGSIEHAIELCPYRYHSKPSYKDSDKPERKALVLKILQTYKGDADLKRFEKEEINWISCVEGINEGQNIANLDVGFIVQLNSQKLDFIQRIGRVLRFRPGHIGKIIILALEDTVDIHWVNKATQGLNATKIRTISLEDLKSGKETILLNQINESCPQ